MSELEKQPHKRYEQWIGEIIGVVVTGAVVTGVGGGYCWVMGDGILG